MNKTICYFICFSKATSATTSPRAHPADFIRLHDIIRDDFITHDHE